MGYVDDRLALRWIVLTAVALGACGGDDPGGPGNGAAFSVSGAVQDTVAGEPVGGATVSIGAQQTTTDFLGSYTIQIEAGEHSVSASALGYETHSSTVTVSGNTTLNLPVTRLAPWVQQFGATESGGRWEATIIALDLQGDLDTSAQLCAGFWDGGTQNVGCNTTGVTQLSATTWRFRVSSSVPQALLEVRFTLNDLAGHSTDFACTPVGICTAS